MGGRQGRACVARIVLLSIGVGLVLQKSPEGHITDTHQPYAFIHSRSMSTFQQICQLGDSERPTTQLGNVCVLIRVHAQARVSTTTVREGHRPNAQLLYAFMDNSWGLPAHKHASRGTQSARGGSERGKDELTGTTTGPSCTETSRGGGLRCLRVETVVDDQYAASHCCENNLDQLRAAARRCNVCAAWFRPSRGKREHTRG